jgi:glutamate synthase domain-containing protein 2
LNGYLLDSDNERFYVITNVLGKNGSTEHCKGNKTVPKTVATTRTEDGYRQNTETSTAIQSERKKEHRATEEEMEGPTSSGGLRNRLTRLNLNENDDELCHYW